MRKKNWGKYKTGNRSGSTNCVGFFSLVLFFVVFFFLFDELVMYFEVIDRLSYRLWRTLK